MQVLFWTKKTTKTIITFVCSLVGGKNCLFLRYILSCHWPIWSIARHPPDQLSATYYQSGSGKTGLQWSPGHTTKQPATPLCRVLNWWGGRGVLSRSLIDCLSPPGRFLKCVRWVLLSVTTRPWSTVGVRVINVLRLTAIFNVW